MDLMKPNSSRYRMFKYLIIVFISFQTGFDLRNVPATSAFPKGSSLNGSSMKEKTLKSIWRCFLQHEALDISRLSCYIQLIHCWDLRSVKGSEWKKSISGRVGGLVCGGMGPTGTEEVVVVVVVASGVSACSSVFSWSDEATCWTGTGLWWLCCTPQCMTWRFHPRCMYEFMCF